MDSNELSPKQKCRLRAFSKIVNNVVSYGEKTRDGQIVHTPVVTLNEKNERVTVNWHISQRMIGVWDRMAARMYEQEFMPDIKLKEAADEIIDVHKTIHHTYKQVEIEKMEDIWKRE